MQRVSRLEKALEYFQDRSCYIFDMDGLLFDSEQLFMEQLAAVMADHGYHLTRDIYTHTLGMAGEPLRKYMTEQYGESYPFEECGSEAQKRVIQIAEHVGLRVKPQIQEVLRILRQEEKTCAVASSTKTEYVEKYLELSGLRDFFSIVIGGEKVSVSKPDPAIFLLAAEKCGVKSEETVVLEDSENGIRAAHAAGMGTICVPDLVQPSEAVQKWIDVLVCPSISV